MDTELNRAFKEWAVACEAMRDGRQTLLIRKGGIREAGGAFAIHDPEFFLMPTYEHQDERLLQTGAVSRLKAMQQEEHDPHTVVMDSYAVVDTILEAKNEVQVNAVSDETIWNPTYIRERFDYRPYDPLYLIVLRVYRLPAPITLPRLSAYGGCTSWVTLDRFLSTEGAVPTIADAEFAARRESLLTRLKHA